MSREKYLLQKRLTRLVLALSALLGLILASHWKQPLNLWRSAPSRPVVVSERFLDPEIPAKFEVVMERWD